MSGIFKILMIYCVFLVSTSVSGKEFPQMYASISTPLYKAAEGYKQLVKMEAFSGLIPLLEAYDKKAIILLAQGFELEKSSDRQSRQNYINALRALQKMQEEIDRDIHRIVKTLIAKQDVKALARLQKNPYQKVQKFAHIDNDLSSKGAQKRVAKDKHTSLLQFKMMLEEARTNRVEEDIACYNDLAALIYWMIQVDELQSTQRWCDAMNTIKQVLSYHLAAKQHCKTDTFTLWDSEANIYETSLHDYLSQACSKP